MDNYCEVCKKIFNYQYDVSKIYYNNVCIECYKNNYVCRKCYESFPRTNGQNSNFYIHKHFECKGNNNKCIDKYKVKFHTPLSKEEIAINIKKNLKLEKLKKRLKLNQLKKLKRNAEYISLSDYVYGPPPGMFDF